MITIKGRALSPQSAAQSASPRNFLASWRLGVRPSLLPAALACFVLLLFACQVRADIGTNDTVTLAWDYPANERSSDLTFTLYHSEDITVPLYQWQVLTVIAGSASEVTVTITVGVHFFYLTASNFWGESDPSNVASTPPRPRSGVLTIRRGR